MEDGEERGLSFTAVQNGRRQPHVENTTTSRGGDTFASKLCGQVFGGRHIDPATKPQAVATAHQAEEEELKPIPGEVTMAIFTGAACALPPGTSGAYSVLFRVYAPDHADHRRPAEMAWYLPSTGHILTCAVVAIAQAIHIANETLRALPTTSQRPKKASIKIFSSFNAALANINDPRKIMRDHDDYVYHQATTLAHNLSRDLADIPGIDVELKLHWLPANQNKPATETAKDCVALHGKDTFWLGNWVKAASEMPQSISLFVEQWPGTNESVRSMPTTSTSSSATPILVYPGPYIPVFLQRNEDSSIPPVSINVAPGTHQPLWWRDLGPACQSTTSTAEGEAVSAVGAEGEESLLEEPMSVIDEAPQLPAEEPVPVKEQDPVHKEARVDCLEREIVVLREEISKRQQMVNEKAKELRQLVPDHPLVLSASSP